jgi:hypothetical protein
VPVPEATVYEYHGAGRPKHDVRVAGKRPRVKSIPEAERPQRTPHREFGSGVASPNESHLVAAFFRREQVHRATLTMRSGYVSRLTAI